jgi:high-affinity nickel-transport protein
MPDSLLASLAVAFALGLRHGFDPDHLATIDALTRWNQAHRPAIARWCGALFSLGHGTVVGGAGVAIAVGAQAAMLPGWIETTGATASIAILVLLAMLNLATVLRTPADRPVVPAGLRGRLLGRIARRSHPASIVLIGALFAVSFDTASQATLFAAYALPRDPDAAWLVAAWLGAAFTAGMLVTDGVNGWWMARLIGRSDRRALVASRIMGLAVAAMALAIAGVGVAGLAGSPAGDWIDGRELWVGTGVVAWMLGAFALGIALTKAGDAAGAAPPATR